MTLKERVKEFCNYMNIPISKFEKDCGLSNGYFNSIKSRPSYDKLMRIFDTYKDMNPEWFYKGVGPMLKSEAQKEASQNTDKTQAPAEDVVAIPSEAWEIIRNQAATMRLMYERIARLERKMAENGLQTSDFGVSPFLEGKNPPPYKNEETK